jgi:hypothetical protein
VVACCWSFRNAIIKIMKLRLLILLALAGCVSNHRNFTVQEVKPFQQGEVIPVRGVYFIRDYRGPHTYYDPPFVIFLFEDGSVATHTDRSPSLVSESDFWRMPDEYLLGWKPTSGHDYGHFTVNDDKITIEIITWRGGIPQHGANRFVGTIGKDSTFVLSTQICRWCPIRHADKFSADGVRSVEGYAFDFYPTKIRPDSSKFWIKKKHWYKKERRKSAG